MRHGRISRVRACAMAALALMFVFAAMPAFAQAPFTYQGRLDIDGQPYTGPAWIQFSLWNAPTDGLLLAPPNVRPNVDVRDGLFTVELDFGIDALQAESHLQLGVATSSQGFFIPVMPRQAMVGAPIASYARNAAGWSTSLGATVNHQVVPSSSAMGPVEFPMGSVTTQTLVTPAAGVLQSVTIYALGRHGPAEFTLSVERDGSAIAVQSVAVPHAAFLELTTIPFDMPPVVGVEEQLRIVIRPTSGTIAVGIISFTSDVYPFGSSSWVNPFGSEPLYTDLTISMEIASRLSVTPRPTVVSGGSLLLQSSRQASTIAISDGPSAGNATLSFLRGSSPSATIGKDLQQNFVIDMGSTRAMTITPAGGVKAHQAATFESGLVAGGQATLNGHAAFNGGATFASTATMLGITSMLGPTNIGAIATPASLGVFGSAEVNSGSLLTPPPVTFRINHANPTTTAWPIRIDNPAVASFAGGMRLSGAGFLEVTNRAGSGLSTGFARLDGTGTWSAVSDARLKTAIEEASSEGLLAAALKVRPVTYFFSHEDAGSRGVPHVGVLAQELREVLPDLVRDDGSYMTVNYAQLSVVAIGAIKAQQERIEAQEAVIGAQQREIETMRERLDAIERAIGAGTKD